MVLLNVFVFDTPGIEDIHVAANHPISDWTDASLCAEVRESLKAVAAKYSGRPIHVSVRSGALMV